MPTEILPSQAPEAASQAALLAGLPLPLASLLARALNAKSPIEKHNCAFYLGEAAVKLAVAVGMARWQSAGAPEPDRVWPRLGSFARPSLGHWVGLLRELERDGHVPPSGPTLPATTALADAAIRWEVLPAASRPGPRDGALGLADVLVAYRNQVLGHGAQRVRGFYAELGPLLLSAVCALAGSEAWVGAGSLAIREAHGWTGLTGLAPLPVEGAPASDAPGLAWITGDTVLPLAPFVVERVDPVLERVQVGFLNRAVCRGSTVRQVAYLDYGTGESFAESDGEPLARLLDGARLHGAASDPYPREPTAETGPDRLGDYRMLDSLGRGAMGVVHKAEQVHLGRVVALKLLAPALLDDAVARSRFEREVRALARVDHPNVVKVLAAGEADGQPYFTMEYVEGADLAKVLAEPEPSALSSFGGGDPHRSVARLFAGAAEGLQALHDAGVLHRDLKPANLVLTADAGRLVVMDLGLAGLADASRALTTGSDSFVGTLRYAAPELLDGSERPAGPTTDVYALGVTLYEVLAGRSMFSGDHRARLIAAILRSDAPPLRQRAPDVPADLAAIVGCATARRPEERFQTAAGLASALTAFAEGLPVVLPGRPRRRPPRTVGYAALGLALVGTVGGGLWWDAVRTHTTEVPWFESTWDGRVPTPIPGADAPGLRHVELVHDHGLVRSATRVNRAGHPDVWAASSFDTESLPFFDPFSPPVTEFSDSNRRVARLELTHGPEGLASVEQRDAHGRTLQRITLEHGDGETRLRVFDPVGRPAKLAKLGVGGILRTVDGAAEIYRWLDDTGNPTRAAMDGSYGHRLERDALGRLVRYTALDSAGAVSRREDGVSSVEVTYGDPRHPHLPTESAWSGLAGVPVLDGAGTHRRVVAWDDEGRPVRVAWFGLDDVAVVGKDGCHAEVVRYLSDGYELTCLGPDGERAAHKLDEGLWASVRRVLDSRGLLVREDHFGLDGEPLPIHRFAVLNDAGELQRADYRTDDGSPVVGPEGFASVVTRYEDGRIVEISTFDAAGGPASVAGEPSSHHLVWDARGLLLEESWRDGQEPTQSSHGWHRAAYGYDERGHRVRERYFDTRGDPTTASGSGVHGWDAIRSPTGVFVEQTFVGVDGHPAVHQEHKWAQVRRELDARGAIRTEAWFGPDGQAVPDGDGVASRERVYDDLGREVEVRSFGLDGELVDSGVPAIVRRTFDAGARLTSIASFGALEQPVPGEDGCAARRMEHDARANLVRTVCLDVAGRPAPARSGIVDERRSYDERDRWIGVAWYDAEGQPTITGVGGHAVAYTLDARGYRTSLQLLGLDLQPITGVAGYARTDMAYDDAGNSVSQAWFDAAGKPARSRPQRDAVHRVRSTFDSAGRAVERVFEDIDGGPVGGVRRHTYRYDARGNAVEEAWFGDDGKLFVNVEGFARLTRTFDAAGRVVRRAHFGADGQLVLDRDGRAIIEEDRDARGNVIERRFYGVDGLPTAGPDGIGGYRYEYDRRDNQISTLFLGPDHQPLRVPGHATGGRARHDAFDRRIEWLHVDADGNPAPNADGVVQTLYRRDRLGNLIHLRNLGVGGRLVAVRDGEAEYRAARGPNGEVRAEEWLGPDGRPVLGGRQGRSCARREQVGNEVVCMGVDEAAARPRIEPTGP